MRLWQLGILVFAVSALVVHFSILLSFPSQIMSKARDTFAARGIVVHQWSASPRMTPQTQSIVRPSPDLAYALCLFDVTQGPVEITAPAWDGDASLALFDRKTNNIFTTSLDAAVDAPRGVMVTDKGVEGLIDTDLPVIELEKEGIALIRRLAPTEESHAAAQALVSRAVCRPLAED